MKIRNLILATAFAISGCVLVPDTSLPPDSKHKTTYVSYELAYPDEVDLCYEEPYWWEPEWCEFYSDGAACCVWYTDGLYEEWCKWDYHWCWEYNGYWW